jgi:hypothetical protein
MNDAIGAQNRGLLFSTVYEEKIEQFWRMIPILVRISQFGGEDHSSMSQSIEVPNP